MILAATFTLTILLKNDIYSEKITANFVIQREYS